MLFPLFADDAHRRDYDMLQEKLWRARVWMRVMGLRRDQYCRHWIPCGDKMIPVSVPRLISN